MFEKISYQGWANCYRYFNDKVEMVITGDVGPRVIRFGFIGQDNEFGEFEDMVGKTGDDEWLIYGGHRLWHAPEVQPRSYFPDNNPIEVTEKDGTVYIVQPTETTTGIQKEIEITLDADSTHVHVVHRLRNHNMWAVELAPWALSVMNTEGKVIIPLPPRGSHTENLLPANTMTCWAYTDMSDPRWGWGYKYITLSQDPNATKPQKIGVMVPDGWAAYARKGHLFLKTTTYMPGENYPDNGCSVETFTNELFIELETVAPLVNLQPGATAEHVEDWYLFDGVAVPESEADIDANVLPLVKSVK